MVSLLLDRDTAKAENVAGFWLLERRYGGIARGILHHGAQSVTCHN